LEIATYGYKCAMRGVQVGMIDLLKWVLVALKQLNLIFVDIFIVFESIIDDLHVVESWLVSRWWRVAALEGRYERRILLLTL
jgi:hypothetical protein